MLLMCNKNVRNYSNLSEIINNVHLYSLALNMNALKAINNGSDSIVSVSSCRVYLNLHKSSLKS